LDAEINYQIDPMAHSSKPNALYAFYDLKVSGADFDFFGFLLPAEWTRRQLEADHLHLVFVFAENNKFLPGLQHDQDHRNWRMNNLLLPCCALLPSVKAITICATREEAQAIYDRVQSPIFPEGYTVENPVSRWSPNWNVLLSNQGHNVKYLKAAQQACDYINNWVERERGDKKTVVITLRSSGHQQQRNMDYEEWSILAHKLWDEGYFVVIVPDTEQAMSTLPPEFESFPNLPPAAMNLELRMALYEAAYLCLFVSNGPAALAFYSRNIQFIQFLAREFIHAPANLESFHGILIGQDDPCLNTFQHLVWKEHTADMMYEEFCEMTSLIDEKVADGTFEDHLDSDPAKREPFYVLGRRFLKYKNWPQLTEYARMMISEKPEEAECYYWKGKALKGELKEDNQEIVKEIQESFANAMELASYTKDLATNADTLTMKVDMLVIGGELDEAEKEIKACIDNENCAYEVSIELLIKLLVNRNDISGAEKTLYAGIDKGLSPTHLRRRIGVIYFEAGNIEKADDSFQYLFEKDALINEDLELWGVIKEELGDFAKAANIYQNAIDNNLATPLIIYRYASVQKQLENYDNAAFLYEWLLDQNYKGWALKVELSEVYFALGKDEEAKALHIEATEERAASLPSRGLQN